MNISGVMIEVGQLADENGAIGFVLQRPDGSHLTVTGLTENEARAAAPHYGRCVTIILAGVAPLAAAGATEKVTAACADDGDAHDLEMYGKAVLITRAHGRASISLVQRHLRIGYNRAARLLGAMEKRGVVSAMSRTGERTVLAEPGAAA